MYDQLDDNEAAIWSLLFASGYLKVLRYGRVELLADGEESLYDLALTNQEVARTFYSMVRRWFARAGADYNDFIKALLLDDADAMNEYMNRVMAQTFGYFDTGKGSSPTGTGALLSRLCAGSARRA